MTNIVLAGGVGKRLWPLSNKYIPKQFIPFFKNNSLFQKTLQRNSSICKKHLVITNDSNYFLAKDQSDEIKNIKCQYLLETLSKNTTVSIALSCLSLKENEIVLITPSDHLIKNQTLYEKAIKKAKSYARKDYIVSFGIKPFNINTNYGYIHVKKNHVLSFHEKPNFKQAKKYIEDKTYYWNSGIICVKAKVILKEVKKFQPELFNSILKVYENSEKNDFIRFQEIDMKKLTSLSIDYTIMENSKKIKMIPFTSYWNDLGSFNSLDKELEKDENENTLNKDFNLIDCKNNFIYTNKMSVTAIDIKDLIIVETNNKLLITKKESTHKLKNIKFKKNENERYYTSYKPWGRYTVLEYENGYKVKKIELNPHKKISLQKHKYRSEHWSVVNGIATVTKKNKKYSIKSGESIFISKKELHRLENNTNELLIIIEVQIGNIVCESDIQRFDDDFNRNKS